MNNKSLKTIILGLILMFSSLYLSAAYEVFPTSKWEDGVCMTSFQIVLTGDAGPFGYSIINEGEVLFSESNLESGLNQAIVEGSGTFTFIIEDSFGCSTEVESESNCECADPQINITQPSCNAQDGIILITPPSLGMINVNWLSWPNDNESPGSYGNVYNNLAEGIYEAEITISYSNQNMDNPEEIECTVTAIYPMYAVDFLV